MAECHMLGSICSVERQHFPNVWSESLNFTVVEQFGGRDVLNIGGLDNIVRRYSSSGNQYGLSRSRSKLLINGVIALGSVLQAGYYVHRRRSHWH